MSKMQLTCTYKLCTDPYARGRLGRLYQAIDCASGTVVSIEDIEFTNDEAAAAWYPTLYHEMSEMEHVRHPNLIHYNSLTLSVNRMHVVSEHAAGGTLQKVLADFDQLHRAIVPQFVAGLLLGLQALHQRGMVHGELSSARVFVGQHGGLKIGCYYPSVTTTEELKQQRVLMSGRSNAATPMRLWLSLTEGMTRDLRSVLWLMTEMLSLSLSQRGINIDPPRLLQLIADYPLEQSFLAHAMQLMLDLPHLDVDAAYERLFSHTYLTPSTWDELVQQETPQQVRVANATLELEQCAATRAELHREIDSWLEDFEASHHRPPKKKDWPAEIVDFHMRLSALKVHMQDLHDAVHHDTANIFGLKNPATLPPNPTDRTITAPETHREHRRRSTAQEAFLSQASARTNSDVEAKAVRAQQQSALRQQRNIAAFKMTSPEDVDDNRNAAHEP
ncbi:Aste57867_8707 [Aphanomyces stellatus]|uniref:Aste57867_8707 protein n=1 Tax=Aphanomyces stellatus TaxID=120398 RepID=A0A485KL47_9STRA|nr:hypothetical protein As57867_008673 [Aphanomyces stellatus]VFT85593.1 Aste57867_8707 [Aphanomyces stellatus]